MIFQQKFLTSIWQRWRSSGFFFNFNYEMVSSHVQRKEKSKWN